MSAYTSGARRNADPLPWDSSTAPTADPDLYRYGREVGKDLNYNGFGLEWAPRPEFDLPARDDINPTLAAFREHLDNTIEPDAPRQAAWWVKLLERADDSSDPLLVARSYGFAEPGTTPGSLAFARRVLAKLASLHSEQAAA